MYRSVSSNRVSDGYFNNHYNSSPPEKVSAAMRALSLESSNELPLYEPTSEAGKKEKNRMKFAENGVHLIPFVLILCAFILWFFSNPDIDVPMKGDSIAAKLEGLTIEGDVDTDGTQTTTLPLELGDLERSTKDQFLKTNDRLIH